MKIFIPRYQYKNFQKLKKFNNFKKRNFFTRSKCAILGPKIRPNRIFWTFLEHRPCRNRFWTSSENGSKILAKREQNPLKLAPKIVNFKKKEIFLRVQNARFWASKSVQIAFFWTFPKFPNI